jgi:hypothetical protein
MTCDAMLWQSRERLARVTAGERSSPRAEESEGTRNLKSPERKILQLTFILQYFSMSFIMVFKVYNLFLN